MRFKKLTALVCTAALMFTTASPALANIKTDEIGAATTIYQQYLTDGAKGEIRLNTNVAGRNPEAEEYINEVLDLSTRLVPFSLDAGLTYYADVNPTTFFINFRNRDYNDLNQYVQNKAKEIAAHAEIYDSDYDKLRYINSYLVDHCDYVMEAVENPDQYLKAFTAFGCLIEGKAVCEGYTNSMQLICEQLDIPCIKVTGSAYGGDHIWNTVYLEDKWWMLDVTFNDPVYSVDNNDRWSYFLLDIDTFNKKGTHTYDQYNFEMSKEIYTGHTEGQRNVTVPFDNLSLRNAQSGDVLKESVLGTIPAAKPDNDQTNTENTDAEVTDQQQENPAVTEKPVVISQATEAKASALNELGLFVGDEGGFRLADTMTRVEMGVMVMRMNDGIAALREKGDYYAQVCPFTDVPQWAKSSIGFLYDNKLAAGQSADKYGTSDVTKRDYAVMMMRVLGIEHSYEDALAIAVTHGILTEEQASGNPVALRADIVDMTYATLQLLEKQQEQEATTPSAIQNSAA